MHGMVSLARPARGHSIPFAAIVLPTLCVVAFTLLIATRPQVPGDTAQAAMLDGVLLWNSILPRAVLALIAGAALGLSGTLLQRVLRNPEIAGGVVPPAGKMLAWASIVCWAGVIITGRLIAYLQPVPGDF